MKTVLTRLPHRAARFILQGEIVAFPTETVYGLGANLFDATAIKKIFIAKGRPADNPLIAHIAELSQISLIAARITKSAQRFIEAFFPGPLTLVLPRRDELPEIATAGLDTIGVRMPSHPITQEFLKACRAPLAAPSANLSGRPSPTTWQAVRADLNGRISCILKGDQTTVGLESTVVDCTGNRPILLRAGAVTLEQLRKINPATSMAKLSSAATPRSPGMKYRHYSPHAKVIITNAGLAMKEPENAAYIGIDRLPIDFKLARVCRDVEEYARELFLFFRVCDDARIATIYCQPVAESGLGLALMDRLKRAAHD
jgi:L-threonylcarbamoyladenylate synthase